MYTTYGIIDPRTGHFVYVGQSKSFEGRKRSHTRSPAEGKKRPRTKDMSIKHWTYDARDAGIMPIIVVLETVETWEDSLASELAWVERLAKENHPLLNKWRTHKEAIRAAKRLNESRRTTLEVGLERLGFEVVSVANIPARRKTGHSKRIVGDQEGKPWTTELDEMVMLLFKEGHGAIEIAHRMERSPNGIRARLVRLGAIERRKDLPNRKKQD